MRKVFAILQKIGISIGLILLLLQMWKGFQSVEQIEFNTSLYSFLFLALLLSIVSILTQILAWVYLMKAFRLQIPWKEGFSGYLLSFLPRYIPGSIWGYLSRGEWLKQKYRTPHKISSIASVLEIIISVTACMTISFLSFIVSRNSIHWMLFIPVLILSLSSTALLLNKYPPKKNLLASFLDTFSFIKIDKTFFQYSFISFALYLFNWLLFGIILTTVIYALGFFPKPLSLNLYMQITFCYSVAWVMGFLIIIVPSGMGIREITLSSLLTEFLLFMPGEANLIAVFSRIVLTIAEVITLALSFLLFLSNQRTHGEK